MLAVTQPDHPKPMPTYDYACRKCGHEFEAFQSMKDAPLEDCPEEECDGKVKRKIGAGAGFLFKGSGFYITDYRSDSYKKAAKNESSAGSKSKSESSGASKESGKGKSGAKKPVASAGSK